MASKKKGQSPKNITEKQKVKEFLWDVTSTDIVRTRSKSLVRDGPTSIDVNKLKNELDVFRLFWTKKLEEGILKYSNEKNGAFLMNLEDFHKYICVSLVLGIIQYPDQRDHWSDSEFFGTKFVQQLISRTSWESFHNQLHFNIEFIKDSLITQFQKYWEPFPHLAVDEGMVPFKGRYRYKQHIRGKPDATGIKIYLVADELGFTWDFWNYAGSQPPVKDIVLGFVKKLHSVQHSIYADSYYGSEQLALELHKLGFKFTLSCQQNRPSWLFGKNMDKLLKNKGDVKYSTHKEYPQIIALAFKDNAVCHFISNQFGKQCQKTEENTSIPTIVDDYRKWYGCVDRANRYHMKWLFPHKHQKWTRALFHSFLKIAVVNSWIFWKQIKNSDMKQKDFLLNLVVQMRNEINNLAPRVTLSSISNFHLIQRSNTRRSCKYCMLTKKKKNSTPFICSTCQIPLHPDCFILYHSQ
jgi:hypothetical protein